MGNKEMFVLAVTLITWAGVFVYLLRLDGLAKKLERELKYREEEIPSRAHIIGAEQLKLSASEASLVEAEIVEPSLPSRSDER